MSAALSTWDASPTQPVDGYNVYLRKGSGLYQKVNVTRITGLQRKLTNLSPGTYSAYETAVRGQNESEPSNVVTFTIEFNSLYKPKNLDSVVAGSDVTLSWDYVPGVTQFRVYLKQGAGSFADQGIVNSNSLEITGLVDDDYDWYVASVYDGSEVDSDTQEFIIGAS